MTEAHPHSHPKHRVVIAAVVVDVNGKILLAKRPSHKKIAPGIWHLPGGHVENSETPQEAIVRELYEEFNIEIGVPQTIFDAFSYHDNEGTTVGITCVVYVKNIVDIHYDTEDTEEIAWVNEEAFSTFLPTDDKDYVILEKFFSHQQYYSLQPTHHAVKENGLLQKKNNSID